MSYIYEGKVYCKYYKSLWGKIIIDLSNLPDFSSYKLKISTLFDVRQAAFNDSNSFLSCEQILPIIEKNTHFNLQTMHHASVKTTLCIFKLVIHITQYTCRVIKSIE